MPAVLAFSVDRARSTSARKSDVLLSGSFAKEIRRAREKSSLPFSSRFLFSHLPLQAVHYIFFFYFVGLVLPSLALAGCCCWCRARVPAGEREKEWALSTPIGKTRHSSRVTSRRDEKNWSLACARVNRALFISPLFHLSTPTIFFRTRVEESPDPALLCLQKYICICVTYKCGYFIHILLY